MTSGVGKKTSNFELPVRSFSTASSIVVNVVISTFTSLASSNAEIVSGLMYSA